MFIYFVHAVAQPAAISIKLCRKEFAYVSAADPAGPCPQCSFCEDFAAAHSSESKVQKSGEGHCYSLFVSGSVVTFIIGAHRQMALLVVLHNYYLRSAKEPRAVLIVLYQHMRGVRFLAQTTEVVFGRGCEVREPRKLSSSIGL